MNDEIDYGLLTLLIWYDIAERYIPRPRQPGIRGPADLLDLHLRGRSTPGHPWRGWYRLRSNLLRDFVYRERARRMFMPVEPITNAELDRVVTDE